MRSVFQWSLGSRVIELGKRTLVMGVVNVTPDSFSDGGRYFDRDRALDHALELLDEGADIIDIGGESTRPGALVSPPLGGAGGEARPLAKEALPVSEKEELERVIPVIRSVKEKRSEAMVSVDTYKANVARAAVEAGAEIVNDVSAFRWDPNMTKTLAGLRCGAVLMHMRGRPEEWRKLPNVADIVLLIKRELSDWSQEATRLGIRRERLVLDPGFGFGKNFEQNFPLLKRLDELSALRFPVLVGISRKSFVGRALAQNGQDARLEERLYGTLAAETVAIVRGAHILRTHDVKASVQAARMADKIA